MSQFINIRSSKEDESSETLNEDIKCPICDCKLEKCELQAHLELEIQKLDTISSNHLDQYSDKELLIDNDTPFEPTVVDKGALSDVFKEVQSNRFRRSAQRQIGVCSTCYPLEKKISEDYDCHINSDEDFSDGYDPNNSDDELNSCKTCDTDSLEYDELIEADDKSVKINLDIEENKNQSHVFDGLIQNTSMLKTNDPKTVTINNKYKDEKLKSCSDGTTYSNVENHNNDYHKRELLTPTTTNYNSESGTETVESEFENFKDCNENVSPPLLNLDRLKANANLSNKTVSLNELQNIHSYKVKNYDTQNLLPYIPSLSKKYKGNTLSSDGRHSETDVLNNVYSVKNPDNNNLSLHEDYTFNKSKIKLKSPILIHQQLRYNQSNYHSQNNLEAMKSENINIEKNSVSPPLINEHNINLINNSQRSFSVNKSNRQNNEIDSLHTLQKNFKNNDNKPQILFTINNSNTGTEDNKYIDLFSTGYPPMCIIINNQIKLTLKKWNCIIGPNKNMFCLLCKKPVSEMTHTKEKHHEYQMALRKREILSEFHYSIITELSEADTYHCGTCNKLLIGIDNVRKHCEDHIHLVLNEDFKRKAQKAIEKLLRKERKEIYSPAVLSITNNKAKAVNSNNLIPIWTLEQSNTKQEEGLNCTIENKIIKCDENENRRCDKNIFFNDNKEKNYANLMTTDTTHNLTVNNNAEKYLHILSIKTFSGYIINRKIRLPTKNWNCITGVKRHLYCNICQKDIKLKGKHRNEQSHVSMMKIKNRRILTEFKYSIISELPMKRGYHCGVCNIMLQELFDVKQHCEEEKHIEARNKCLTLESTDRAKHLEQAKLYEKLRRKACNELRNNENKTLFDNCGLVENDSQAKRVKSVNVPEGSNKTDIEVTKNASALVNCAVVVNSSKHVDDELVLNKIEINVVYDGDTKQKQNKYVKNKLDAFIENELHTEYNNTIPQLMNAKSELIAIQEAGKYLNVNSVEKITTFIINRQASLTSRKWNCITGTNNNPFCSLCRRKPSNHYFHIEEKKHLALVEQKKSRILSEFDYSIIS